MRVLITVALCILGLLVEPVQGSGFCCGVVFAVVFLGGPALINPWVEDFAKWRKAAKG